MKAKEVLASYPVLLKVITLKIPVPCVLLENDVLQSWVGSDWRRQGIQFDPGFDRYTGRLETG